MTRIFLEISVIGPSSLLFWELKKKFIENALRLLCWVIENCRSVLRAILWFCTTPECDGHDISVMKIYYCYCNCIFLIPRRNLNVQSCFSNSHTTLSSTSCDKQKKDKYQVMLILHKAKLAVSAFLVSIPWEAYHIVVVPYSMIIELNYST